MAAPRYSLALVFIGFCLSACVVVPQKGARATTTSSAQSPGPKSRLVIKRSRGGKANLQAHARTVMRDAGDLLAALGGYITCFDKRLLERALKRGDAGYARRQQKTACVRRMGAVAAAQGFNTFTVGVSGGGSFIVGGFIDTGFAFDTRGRRAPTLYQTKAISIGFQAGGGVGLNLGLYRGANTPNARGSDTHGFSFEAGVGVGAGTAIWYDYKGNFDGMSVSVIAGASGKAGAYNRINTSYYNIRGVNPISCGGKNQRACNVWERVPSCNKGLYEQIGRGICRARKSFPCGRKNQRPCKLWERIPSCNRGLREHFLRGKCV